MFRRKETYERIKLPFVKLIVQLDVLNFNARCRSIKRFFAMRNRFCSSERELSYANDQCKWSSIIGNFSKRHFRIMNSKGMYRIYIWSCDETLMPVYVHAISSFDKRRRFSYALRSARNLKVFRWKAHKSFTNISYLKTISSTCRCKQGGKDANKRGPNAI